MPIISQFYGILIYLYRELNGQHNTPHIHALYGEYEMSVSFSGEIIVGNFPNKQRNELLLEVLFVCELDVFVFSQ